jgi:hypothetical protein
MDGWSEKRRVGGAGKARQASRQASRRGRQVGSGGRSRSSGAEAREQRAALRHSSWIHADAGSGTATLTADFHVPTATLRLRNTLSRHLCRQSHQEAVLES